MKLYTCEDGKELHEIHNDVFGAWTEKEMDKHYYIGMKLYSFEVNEDSLCIGESDHYPHYVKNNIVIDFKPVYLEK